MVHGHSPSLQPAWVPWNPVSKRREGKSWEARQEGQRRRKRQSCRPSGWFLKKIIFTEILLWTFVALGFLFCQVLLFWDKISNNSGCLSSCYVVKGDLELWILLLLYPQCCDHRPVLTCLIYAVLGIKPGLHTNTLPSGLKQLWKHQLWKVIFNIPTASGTGEVS